LKDISVEKNGKDLNKKNSSQVRHIELFNLITEIEKKFDVDTIKLEDNTKLWNAIRIFLYFHVINKPSRSGAVYYKRLFYMLTESLLPLKIPDNKKIWGFSTSRHRRRINNKYFDIFMDPLYEVFRDNFTVFERASTEGYHRNYQGKIYSKSYVSIHFSVFTKVFWKLALNRFFRHKKISIKSKKTLQEIIQFFSKKTSVDNHNLKNDIYNLISIIRYNKDFYKKILAKKKPSYVFMVAGHSADNMALCQACKEYNIPSIELQHGMITKYHPAYLKFTESKNKDYRPEYLLTFGDAYTNMIKKGNLFKPENIVSIGFPYLETKKKKTPHVDGKLKDFVKKYSRSIFVTSQWNFADEIREFVLEVSKKLSTLKKKVGIVFKPHPSDWKDYSDLHKYKNIFATEKYDDPYEIFKIIDIHTTLYSTSSLEALSFGKPNIFLDIGNIKEMFDIVDNKSSFNAKNPEEYLDKLEFIISNYENVSKEAKKAGTEFYNEKPKEKLEEFLKNLEYEK